MNEISKTELYYLLSLISEDIQNVTHGKRLDPIAPELIIDVENDVKMAQNLQEKLQEMLES